MQVSFGFSKLEYLTCFEGKYLTDRGGSSVDKLRITIPLDIFKSILAEIKSKNEESSKTFMVHLINSLLSFETSYFIYEETETPLSMRQQIESVRELHDILGTDWDYAIGHDEGSVLPFAPQSSLFNKVLGGEIDDIKYLICTIFPKYDLNIFYARSIEDEKITSCKMNYVNQSQVIRSLGEDRKKLDMLREYKKEQFIRKIFLANSAENTDPTVLLFNYVIVSKDIEFLDILQSSYSTLLTDQLKGVIMRNAIYYDADDSIQKFQTYGWLPGLMDIKFESGILPMQLVLKERAYKSFELLIQDDTIVRKKYNNAETNLLQYIVYLKDLKAFKILINTVEAGVFNSLLLELNTNGCDALHMIVANDSLNEYLVELIEKKLLDTSYATPIWRVNLLQLAITNNAIQNLTTLLQIPELAVRINEVNIKGHPLITLATYTQKSGEQVKYEIFNKLVTNGANLEVYCLQYYPESEVLNPVKDELKAVKIPLLFTALVKFHEYAPRITSLLTEKYIQEINNFIHSAQLYLEGKGYGDAKYNFRIIPKVENSVFEVQLKKFFEIINNHYETFDPLIQYYLATYLDGLNPGKGMKVLSGEGADIRELDNVLTSKLNKEATLNNTTTKNIIKALYKKCVSAMMNSAHFTISELGWIIAAQEQGYGGSYGELKKLKEEFLREKNYSQDKYKILWSFHQYIIEQNLHCEKDDVFYTTYLLNQIEIKLEILSEQFESVKKKHKGRKAGACTVSSKDSNITEVKSYIQELQNLAEKINKHKINIKSVKNLFNKLKTDFVKILSYTIPEFDEIISKVTPMKADDPKTEISEEEIISFVKEYKKAPSGEFCTAFLDKIHYKKSGSKTSQAIKSKLDELEKNAGDKIKTFISLAKTNNIGTHLILELVEYYNKVSQPIIFDYLTFQELHEPSKYPIMVKSDIEGNFMRSCSEMKGAGAFYMAIKYGPYPDDWGLYFQKSYSDLNAEAILICNTDGTKPNLEKIHNFIQKANGETRILLRMDTDYMIIKYGAGSDDWGICIQNIEREKEVIPDHHIIMIYTGDSGVSDQEAEPDVNSVVAVTERENTLRYESNFAHSVEKEWNEMAMLSCLDKLGWDFAEEGIIIFPSDSMIVPPIVEVIGDSDAEAEA